MPERRADAVVAAATEWIGRQQQPWFAWVHVFDPHAPYAPPAPFDRQYADSPYAGEVAFTDSALAPLLDAARDASGRPTLVIVTGDHGEGLGDHGELTHGLFAYESTLRIPLIIAQLTRQSAAFASHADPASAQASGLVGQASRLPCAPPSPRATWTSCPPSSTLLACRSRRASRDGACCPGAWTTTARVRPTSRRSRPCTTGAGRRSPECLSIGTSSSTCRCRSCTTCGSTRRRPRTSPAGKPSASGCSKPGSAGSGPRRPPPGRPRTRLRGRACRRWATSRARRLPRPATPRKTIPSGW